jgi:hypothetical protein
MFKVTLPSASTPPTPGRPRGTPCPSRPLLASLQGLPTNHPGLQGCQSIIGECHLHCQLPRNIEGFRKTAMSDPTRADKHETMTGYMHAVNHSLWQPCRQEGSGRIRGGGEIGWGGSRRIRVVCARMRGEVIIAIVIHEKGKSNPRWTKARPPCRTVAS